MEVYDEEEPQPERSREDALIALMHDDSVHTEAHLDSLWDDGTVEGFIRAVAYLSICEDKLMLTKVLYALTVDND